MAIFEPHGIVTGASSGIGAAVAARLLDKGWHVTGIDRQSPPTALVDRGLRYLAADLADDASVAALDLPTGVNAVTAFVHCAGIMRADTDPAARADLATLLWRVHVGAAEALIRRLIPTFQDGLWARRATLEPRRSRPCRACAVFRFKGGLGRIGAQLCPGAAAPRNNRKCDSPGFC